MTIYLNYEMEVKEKSQGELLLSLNEYGGQVIYGYSLFVNYFSLFNLVS